jgi:hypothetical protein
MGVIPILLVKARSSHCLSLCDVSRPGLVTCLRKRRNLCIQLIVVRGLCLRMQPCLAHLKQLSNRPPAEPGQTLVAEVLSHFRQASG